MDPELQSADWSRLRALRDRFLGDPSSNYWKDQRDLELYDLVFAERIGWKWDAVLAALRTAGWSSSAQQIYDWGCGTGIASRKASAAAGILKLQLYDRSSIAVDFALDKLRGLGVDAHLAAPPDRLPPGTLLIVSHVLNELPAPALQRLAALASSADELIWMEPGTHEVSRRLGSIRDGLIASGLHMIAPCVADIRCPMLTPEHEHDWCHFFAPPPNEIFHSSFWREVSSTLEIDLRSLPYSYIAASRAWAPQWQDGVERLIGRAREFKAHCDLLCCGRTGLATRTLQKRNTPELFRSFAKGKAGSLFEWQIDPEKPSRILKGHEAGSG